jgi:hypothetical protein
LDFGGPALLTIPDMPVSDHILSQRRSKAKKALQSRTVGVAFPYEGSRFAVKREWSDDATGPELSAGLARRNHIVELLVAACRRETT